MKRLTDILSRSLLLLLLAALPLAYACESESDDSRTQCPKAQQELDEAGMIAEYLEKSGDPVNCKESCSITARELMGALYGNTYVIDMRRLSDYQRLHIPGAVNVPFEKLHYHFYITEKPRRYDKVVLVCYTGQSATYAASLLRMQGFNNVYALRWGMASWHSSMTSKWSKAVTEHTDLDLEATPATLTERHPFPHIETGKVWRGEMRCARAKDLMAIGFRKVGVKASELPEHPGALIIAYCTPEEYALGHPAGAVLFPVRQSLRRDSMLNLLPPDREIILYSRNGFESAYATAYLRLLGYDAHTLLYGMNSFMALSNDGPGSVFNSAEVNDFPLEGSEAAGMHSHVPDLKAEAKPAGDAKPKTVTKPKPKPVLKPAPAASEDEGC